MPVTWSVFDVIGPVMVGPSSSHTAGACRVGYMAQAINGRFKKVDIYLHGSFADVYEGHRTDLALVAGVLRMQSHDKRLRHSFDVAKEEGIEFNIIPTDLGQDLHPNTAKLVFDENEAKAVIGSSIGGGKAVVDQIGKIPIQVSLEHSTLLLHFDQDNIKAPDVLTKINESGRTIVDISTGNYKNYTIMAVEVKEWFTPEDVESFEALEGVNWAKFVNHIPNFVELTD